MADTELAATLSKPNIRQDRWRVVGEKWDVLALRSDEREYTASSLVLPENSAETQSEAPEKRNQRIVKLWYLLDAKGKEANAMVTALRCALVPTVAFHSTPVMNFIDYFGIVILYGSVTELGLGW
ncbi:hypothetical protein BKA70DRAFT_1562246 [Coprinopsis sp. MPI-PUGE-AT-0042]|nr:hypothetical protein BKA70DRAFT_1562246 [Coprinopsis sp. MPI-PUGE-AT-0042]